MTHYADIPPRTYEITWQSGHVETVIAHQVTYPDAFSFFGGRSSRPTRIQFHAEVDGVWALQLSAVEDDIRTVRDITAGERIAPSTETR
jgi:hypothetical protein